MLTKTTVSAIRALIHVGLHGSGGPISPRRIAEQLGESPTYLAKVMRLLVKAGILRAHFGMAGGVVLHAPQKALLSWRSWRHVRERCWQIFVRRPTTWPGRVPFTKPAPSCTKLSWALCLTGHSPIFSATRVRCRSAWAESVAGCSQAMGVCSSSPRQARAAKRQRRGRAKAESGKDSARRIEEKR